MTQAERIAKFPKTRQAVRAHDLFSQSMDAELDRAKSPTTKQVLNLFEILEDYRRKVGHAFGLETADVNSMDTCERHIKPNEWLRKTIGLIS